jgi:hypothetical protein
MLLMYEVDFYISIEDFYYKVPEAAKLKHVMKYAADKGAAGSGHNHQAWPGGYADHVTEVLNIAIWLYVTSPRKLPFKLEDALLVLFLHDIEKPFKIDGHVWTTKEARRAFRELVIQMNEVRLTDEQKNALEYVEGEHDYSGTERKMGPMAAFCHICDVFSARVWHDKGREHSW